MTINAFCRFFSVLAFLLLVLNYEKSLAQLCVNETFSGSQAFSSQLHILADETDWTIRDFEGDAFLEVARGSQISLATKKLACPSSSATLAIQLEFRFVEQESEGYVRAHCLGLALWGVRHTITFGVALQRLREATIVLDIVTVTEEGKNKRASLGDTGAHFLPKLIDVFKDSRWHCLRLELSSDYDMSIHLDNRVLVSRSFADQLGTEKRTGSAKASATGATVETMEKTARDAERIRAYDDSDDKPGFLSTNDQSEPSEEEDEVSARITTRDADVVAKTSSELPPPSPFFELQIKTKSSPLNIDNVLVTQELGKARETSGASRKINQRGTAPKGKFARVFEHWAFALLYYACAFVPVIAYIVWMGKMYRQPEEPIDNLVESEGEEVLDGDDVSQERKKDK